ncbi:DUF202 domain-containing protein [Auraticoccus monumenti]|uniref:Uncharacterized membrane protein YidH, DUF202 family n=1 Tax=Auraticoccus monumenti TaxID=675864 RepID=A0A1G6WDD1_9ACTN|nr:DUF202 domain-containing protein [Auraticoccus monumenti]SDD63076.1 Uncharacterized membrane protein YidH, DUF202 family [Auraticoccus monumenti]
MSTLFDRGAQNERTRLAWQRTLLSLVLCALVVARLVTTRALLPGLAVAGVALVLAGGLAVLTRRRYRAAESALRGSTALPDGRAALLLTLLVVTVAAGAAVLLVTWG